MAAINVNNNKDSKLDFFFRAIARSTYWHLTLLLIVLVSYFVIMPHYLSISSHPEEEHPLLRAVFYFFYPCTQLVLNFLVHLRYKWPVYLKSILLSLIGILIIIMCAIHSIVWLVVLPTWALSMRRYYLVFTIHRDDFLMLMK